jgi:Lrp/AsnC family leucine-responsive transcriptional regulator
VYQRTRKLVASGAIAGFRARVDPAQVGYPVLAFVRVELGAEADADQLLAQWAATPECEACYALGDADGFLLRYRLPSMEALGPHLRTMRLRGARPHADLTIRTIFERDVTPRAGA